MIYIVDFDNILTDHRKVSKQKADIGLYFEFFKNFFLNYSSENTQFIFVLQTDKYVDLLCKFILEKFTNYNIRFVIVENHTNLFVCHYFYHLLRYYDDIESKIISNDKSHKDFQFTSIEPKLSINVLKLFYNQFQSTKKIFMINEVIFSKINKITLNYQPFYLISII